MSLSIKGRANATRSTDPRPQEPKSLMINRLLVVFNDPPPNQPSIDSGNYGPSGLLDYVIRSNTAHG